MKIFLVRHGESTGNAEDRFIGAKGNYPLTEMGKDHAKNAGRVLRNLEVSEDISFYTSPVARALETAQIISKMLNLNYLEDSRLREIELGEMEGKKKSEVEKQYADVIRKFSEKPSECEIPGGESIPQVQQRVLSFVYDRLDEGKDLIIVAHDIVIRSFLIHAMSMSIDFIWSLSPSELASTVQSPFEYGDTDIPHGSVSVVNYGNGEFEVESIGLT